MKVGLYTTLLAVFVVAILSPPTNACRRDRELFDIGDNNNVEHNLRKLDGHSAHGLWDVFWGKIMKCVSYWKGEEEECVDPCTTDDEGTCCTAEDDIDSSSNADDPCCGDLGRDEGLFCGAVVVDPADAPERKFKYP